MKLLLHQSLARTAAQARLLREPAGFRYRVRGELAMFQPWLDKVARLSRPIRLHR